MLTLSDLKHGFILGYNIKLKEELEKYLSTLDVTIIHSQIWKVALKLNVVSIPLDGFSKESALNCCFFY